MRALDLDAVLAATGGRAFGAPFAGEVSAVTTDSRAVTEGCLFAAIPGERVDGHDFIAAAFASGAACALARRVPEGVTGCVIVVPDTVAALQALAGFYRSRFDIPVVGVTGSVGKTTMKEMLAAVLGRRYTVHKTPGNFNNDLGVPLTLLGLREEHTAAVVELGVSHPGDMGRIASIAKPTAAVYTNIGDAHLEFLGSRAGVLREKSAMIAYLPPEGTVFCNGDDPLLRDMECPRRKVCFGLGEHNAVRGSRVAPLPGGATACTVAAGSRSFSAAVPAFGEYLAYALLGAAAVALELGLTPEEIAAGAADYAPVGSRGRLVRTPCLTVVDDSYNANPTSCAAALRSLAAVPGRTAALLGDMLELGPEAERMHRETGALAAALGVDAVLAAGGFAAAVAEGAGARGRAFPDRAALLAALPELLRPGDTVLVKASRGARFDEVAAFLETLDLAGGADKR